MTASFNKLIPIFAGLFLIVRGIFWIADGKCGNRRSYFFGLAAIIIGIMMLLTLLF